MAILIDERARNLISRRRARALDHAVALHLRRFRGHGSLFYGGDVVTEWVTSSMPASSPVSAVVDAPEVHVDERLRRYAYWHDVTISASRLGPFETLTLDPHLLFKLEEWERNHPVARDQAVA